MSLRNRMQQNGVLGFNSSSISSLIPQYLPPQSLNPPVLIFMIFYFYKHDKDDTKRSPFEGRYKNLNIVVMS